MKTAVGRSRGYSQTRRAEAAAETGERIVRAFIDRLFRQWFDEVTLDAVAADAGVTVQTVVRRFGGKDGLLAASLPTLAAGIGADRGMPVGDVDALVANLFRDYESTGDTVIRLLALEPRHPALVPFMNVGRQEHREWLAGVMAREVSRLPAARREKFLDALVVVTDVYAWKLLRRDMNRSLPDATATTRSLVRAVVREFSKNKGKGDAT